MTNPFALPLPAGYQDLSDEELDALCRSNSVDAEQSSRAAKPWHIAVWILTAPAIVLAIIFQGRYWLAIVAVQWLCVVPSAYYSLLSIRRYRANHRMYGVLIARTTARIEALQKELQ